MRSNDEPMMGTHRQNSQFPKVLGVIGARSGSKGIPDKNIRPLLGKPLMAWMIESARKSQYITKLLVSTDNENYASIAQKYGADAPFLRPQEISTDTSVDIEYLTHATKWVEEHECWKPDIVLRLPATAPLCKPEFIDRCIERLTKDPLATSARTVTDAPKHPYKLWRIDTTGKYLIPFCPKNMTGYDEPFGMPRQMFPPSLSHTDCIAVRYEIMMRDRSLSGERVAFHAIPKTDAMDIDTEMDFLVAEMLLKKRLENE